MGNCMPMLCKSMTTTDDDDDDASQGSRQSRDGGEKSSSLGRGGGGKRSERMNADAIETTRDIDPSNNTITSTRDINFNLQLLVFDMIHNEYYADDGEGVEEMR